MMTGQQGGGSGDTNLYFSDEGDLRSHLVIITGYQGSESFLEAAQRQLEQLAIQGNLRILIKADGTPKRKSIKVKRFMPSDSEKLQYG